MIFNERGPSLTTIHLEDGFIKNARIGRPKYITALDEKYWERATRDLSEVSSTPVGRALILEAAKVLQRRASKDAPGVRLTDVDWESARTEIERQLIPKR
jgi:hypothetical protein